MSKKLEEMSLEELWQLFPIFLVEHSKDWELWYEEEKRIITSLIPKEYIIRVAHIGSTAISNIWAKNIVDILIELNLETQLEQVKNILTNNGWLCMSEDLNRISMNKGYTEQGFADRVFHLHLRIKGDNDELYFRDYLRENEDIAKEYESLKLSLWRRFEHNRDGYTDAKTDFIKKYTQIAKESYGARY
jgi:hypothetical protein